MVTDHKSAAKMTGFAQGERPKGDFYATPPIAVESLLQVESFSGKILEPCCGNGAVSKVLIEHGYDHDQEDQDQIFHAAALLSTASAQRPQSVGCSAWEPTSSR